MITFIRGTKKKLALMETLYQGTANSVFFQYGYEIALTHTDKAYGIVERQQHTRNNPDQLKAELKMYVIEIMREVPHCETIFIYGNFDESEKPKLMELSQEFNSINFWFSQQDDEIEMGKLILEEFE